MNLPRPAVQAPVPIFLGGEVDERLSDASLVTAMIYRHINWRPA
jgi:hypothetical protein